MMKRTAQFWLGGVWVGGALLLAIVLLLQTVVYSFLGEHDEELWKWFSTAVLPNTTLMLGVLGAQAFGARAGGVHANRLLFGMAIFASLLYLIVISIVIALIGIRFSIRPWLSAQLPLAFFQAVTTVLIGIFFVGESSARSG